MNKFSVCVLSGLLFATALPTVQAEESFSSWFWTTDRKKEVAPVTDEAYNEECGSCHYAYPAGLLPSASWQKLIDAKALQDHFGDNAELDEETRSHIQSVLLNGAAEKSYYKRSRKIMSSLDEGAAPLRITEVPYIKEKHEEIPTDWITKNPKVKSLSHCNKCHRKADEANFDDDTVMIPGHENEDFD